MTNEEAEKAIDIIKNEMLCVGSNCDRDCGKCPLVKDENDILDSFGKAINALEKQIQKKPIQINEYGKIYGDWKTFCPNCGALLMERITTENELYPIPHNEFVCCWCGQHIDWGYNNDTKND